MKVTIKKEIDKWYIANLPNHSGYSLAKLSEKVREMITLP